MFNYTCVVDIGCVVLLQEWWDYMLTWDPDEYGGVTVLYVPSDEIWQPDIVLYDKSVHRSINAEFQHHLMLHVTSKHGQFILYHSQYSV